MVQIKEFSLKRLHNGEFLQFMNDFDKSIIDATAVALGVEPEYTQFKPQITNLDTTMRVEKGSLKTTTINQLNAKRIKTWAGIKAKVRAGINSPVAAEAASAIVISKILKKHGDIRNYSLIEKSGEYTNLLNDLKSTANSLHLTNLGLTSWITSLKADNDLLIKTFNERNAEFSTRISGDSSEVRVEIEKHYNTIVAIINASILLKTAKPIAITLATELNEKIDYYQNILLSRRAQNTKKKKGKVSNTDTDSIAGI